jgi:hypothetical protein
LPVNSALGFENNMPYLIKTIYNFSTQEAADILEQTHQLIVDCAINSQKELSTDTVSWGANIKRLTVPLPFDRLLVGKSGEKFVEIINILATAERTIDALKWFLLNFPESLVKECHPSTSDNSSGNDIVLIDNQGKILVRCEVCDVASSNTDQNKKEKKDLKNLGCNAEIPDDSVKRYIATSEEFAKALSSPKRKWSKMHYRYILHSTATENKTVILEITRA